MQIGDLIANTKMWFRKKIYYGYCCIYTIFYQLKLESVKLELILYSENDGFLKGRRSIPMHQHDRKRPFQIIHPLTLTRRQ